MIFPGLQYSSIVLTSIGLILPSMRPINNGVKISITKYHILVGKYNNYTPNM